MSPAPLVAQAEAVLLATLRIAPALAFSPPFTLFRIPALVRVMLALALAAFIVAGDPGDTWRQDIAPESLIVAASGELMLGIALALSLQFCFAALLTVGRAIDIQIGFGLAALVDPATRSQLPLVGTVFAYAAAAIFFLGDGPADLFALWSASFHHLPLGALPHANPASLVGVLSTAFLVAAGLGGAIVLALFLTDLAIAFMSRTLPQMNVLVLGFQVKTLVALALLPAVISVSGGLFLDLLRIALDAAPRLIADAR